MRKALIRKSARIAIVTGSGKPGSDAGVQAWRKNGARRRRDWRWRRRCWRWTAATGCDWLAGRPAAMERLVTRDMTPQGINGSRSGKGGPDAALGGQARSSGALVPSPGAIAGPGERPAARSLGASPRDGAPRANSTRSDSAEGDAELDLAARRNCKTPSIGSRPTSRLGAPGGPLRTIGHGALRLRHRHGTRLGDARVSRHARRRGVARLLH